jgi:hypothetical protein
MSFDYHTLNSDMILGPMESATLEADGTANWVSAFSKDMAFGHKISSVAFNLNSEQYGTHYFVDVCYRGSQKDYDKYGIKTEYRLTQNSLSYTEREAIDHDGPSTLDYLTQAGISVSSHTVCDTQLTGSSTGPDNGFQSWVFGDIDLVTPANSDSNYVGAMMNLSPGNVVADWAGYMTTSDDLGGVLLVI